MNKEFKWTSCCATVFQKVEDELTKDTTLMPFNPKLPIAVAVDASPVGLGAVLFHILPDGSEWPIAFASRTLSDVEKQYFNWTRKRWL